MAKPTLDAPLVGGRTTAASTSASSLTLPRPSALLIQERLEDVRMRIPKLTDLILARSSGALRTRVAGNLERAERSLQSARHLAGPTAGRATQKELSDLADRISSAKEGAASIFRPGPLTMSDVQPLSREVTNEVISAMQDFRLAFWKQLWSFPALQRERIETLERALEDRLSLPRFVFVQRGKPFSEARVSELVCQARAAHQAADFRLAGSLLAELPMTPERSLALSSQLEREAAQFLDASIRSRTGSASLGPDELDPDRGRFGIDPLEVRSRLNQMAAERQRYLACKDYLFAANERLVISFTHPTGELRLYNDDFFQNSRTGLLKAIERFDTSCGNALSTVAVSWIRDSQKDQVGDYCSGISIPSQSRLALARLRSALETRAMGQEEALQSLAAWHNLGADTMLAVSLFHGGVVDLESPAMLENGQTGSLRDLIAARRSHAPEAPLEAQELVSAVGQLLLGLSPDERTAIKMIFGIGYDDPHTVREVSARLGIGARKINTMKDRVLRSLRKTLEDSGFGRDLLPY